LGRKGKKELAGPKAHVENPSWEPEKGGRLVSHTSKSKGEKSSLNAASLREVGGSEKSAQIQRESTQHEAAGAWRAAKEKTTREKRARTQTD